MHMPKFDTRIDEYIVKSADFAQPVLIHLRELIHDTCPDVQETMKWSFPHFEYAGSILCSMAAFKQHCAFGLWLGSLLKDNNGILSAVGEKTAMGHLGQIKTLEDLPEDKVLAEYIRQAMILNEKGIKLPKKAIPAAPKELIIPDYLLEALEDNPIAQEHFERFSYSNKKEYVDWLTDAKTETTRASRLATTIEWLEEGKVRNWKYLKC